MKKVLFILFALIAAAATVVGLIYAYQAMRAERAAESGEEKPVVAESRIKRLANGEYAVVLDAEIRQRLALEISSLATTNLTREIRAYGKVLDVSTLAVFNTELQTVEVASELAKKELARVKQLYEQGQNASLRSVEVAEAEWQKNLLARQAVKDRLALAWGKTVAEQPDLGAFLRSFIGWQNALVRLDLLPGETVATAPSTARIALQANDAATFEGALFGVPPAVDATVPVQSFTYLVKGAGWAPGTKVIGSLKREGENVSGLLMPDNAVVRANGLAWAYRQTAADTFIRRRVSLEQPAAGGWLVGGDWKAGDQVVTRGAQVLLSEELKSQIKLLE